MKSGEDETDKILFELSSTRRTAILNLIAGKDLRMQEVARKLDMNVTEAFRHLQRLSEAGLVWKKATGSYGLTPLGKLGMSLRSGFVFVSSNAEYFADHDVSSLPYEFIERIGELSEGEPSPNMISTMNYIDKMAQETQDHIWTISDQVQDSSAKIAIERMRRGEITLRLVLPEGYVSRYAPVAGVEDRIERRYLPKISIGLGVTDKEAFVAFPSTKGALDYTGFTGRDPRFVKWARDLYLHEWDKAKPRRPMTSEY